MSEHDLKKKKVQRCPKGHAWYDTDRRYCLRLRKGYTQYGYHSEDELNHSATFRKLRNLIALLEELDEVSEELYDEVSLEDVDVADFCRRMEISRITCKRLFAVMADYLGIPYNCKIEVKNTQTNRRYKIILTLYKEMKTYGVDLSDFCKKYKISRATFFRYLSDIDEYFTSVPGELHIGIGDNGLYYIVDPRD